MCDSSFPRPQLAWQARQLERWHQTLKVTTIRAGAPSSLAEARRLVERFVEYYNHHRLHSAIGFITPADLLAGRAGVIWAARDEKLEQARERRRMLRRERSSTERQITLTLVC